MKLLLLPIIGGVLMLGGCNAFRPTPCNCDFERTKAHSDGFAAGLTTGESLARQKAPSQTFLQNPPDGFEWVLAIKKK